MIYFVNFEMNRIINNAPILIMACCVAISTKAAPVVIYDNPNISKPITPYLPYKKPTKYDIEKALSKLPNNINFTSLTNRFPITTSNMSVGKVQKRATEYAPSHAMCLLGYDEVSLAWLRLNYQFLASINTICLVVNINNKKQLQTLKTNFVDIQFEAISAVDIAKQLQLKHYPILVYNNSIEQ